MQSVVELGRKLKFPAIPSWNIFHATVILYSFIKIPNQKRPRLLGDTASFTYTPGCPLQPAPNEDRNPSLFCQVCMTNAVTVDSMKIYFFCSWK